MQNSYGLGTRMSEVAVVLIQLLLCIHPSLSHAILSPDVVYCNFLGYTYLTEQTAFGEGGICQLPDGQRVDAHAFVAGRVALNWSYCAQNGYEAKHYDDSEMCKNCLVCVLEDGSEVEVTRLMRLNLKETTCGDGTCGIPENFNTCPADCPSGGRDGYCDGVMDGMRDADCAEAVGLCQDRVVVADAACTASANIDAGSYDPDEGGLLTRSQNPPEPYPLGEGVVTLTVTNTSGDSDVCTGTVTVEDSTPPEITLNGDSEIAIECGVVYEEPGATAADNCDADVGVNIGGASVNSSVPAEYVITYNARDSTGNEAQASRTVTVIDTTSPVVGGVSASPSVLWPPDHKMRSVTVEPATTDTCDQKPPACMITSVTSNEPGNGCGRQPKPRKEEKDWVISGDLSVDLRAERCGGGSGRVYTIAISCADASRNVTEGSVAVTVPHDRKLSLPSVSPRSLSR